MTMNQVEGLSKHKHWISGNQEQHSVVLPELPVGTQDDRVTDHEYLFWLEERVHWTDELAVSKIWTLHPMQQNSDDGEEGAAQATSTERTFERRRESNASVNNRQHISDGGAVNEGPVGAASQ